MFLPTKAHKQEISSRQKRLRLGYRVPEDAVNLAYAHVPSLNPTENMQISDTSGFILENIQTGQVDDVLMSPDDTMLLRTANGDPVINAEIFLITNRFKDNTPLFFAHRLKWKVPSKSQLTIIKSISLIDHSGATVDKGTYDIVSYGAGETASTNLFEVWIYTSFQTTPSNPVQVIYTAYQIQGTGSKVVPGIIEQLNPQPALRQVSNISELLETVSLRNVYYRANGPDVGTSKVYVPHGETNATPIYKIRLSHSNQIKPLLPRETSPLENWYLRIQNGRFQRILRDTRGNVVQTYMVPEYFRQPFGSYGLPYMQINNEKPKVTGPRRIKVKYTPLFVDVDIASAVPKNLSVEVNGIVANVLNWDVSDGSIELDTTVRETDHILVDYSYEENSYTYRGYYNEVLGEFISLDFNPGYGHIYRRIEGEVPFATVRSVSSFTLINKTVYIYLRATVGAHIISNANTVAITMSGAFGILANTISADITNIKVLDRFGETVPHWGTASSEPAIGTGYWWTWISENARAAIEIKNYLDGAGHPVDPSAHFSMVVDNSGDAISAPGIPLTQTLYHSFAPVLGTDDILLAKIQVRPNSSRTSIRILDTRTRGGGLLTSIGQAIMDNIAPDSKYYWDIGYWDGEPYQENAVIVIRLSQKLLKENGGQFSRDEVNAVIDKHIAFGTYYIVDYVDEPELLQQVPEDLSASFISQGAVKLTFNRNQDGTTRLYRVYRSKTRNVTRSSLRILEILDPQSVHPVAVFGEPLQKITTLQYKTAHRNLVASEESTPQIVYVNGTEASATGYSYQVDAVPGSIRFTTQLPESSIVTMDYYFDGILISDSSDIQNGVTRFGPPPVHSEGPFYYGVEAIDEQGNYSTLSQIKGTEE